MKEHDWSRPQRQPAAGLAIAYLHTLWEVAKSLWPLLLLMLFGKEGRMNKYEVVGLVFLVITVFTALMRFLYFRFYLEDQKLVIKKGWLKKETQVIPLEKIQTVNIEQGPLHRLLNVVKLSIDTAGSQKAEATIDSLHHAMAEALRQQLLSKTERSAEMDEAISVAPAVVHTLGIKDLLKLSISANHLEAFFILLSFAFGLYQNLSDIDNSWLSSIEERIPAGSLYLFLALAVLTLLITMLVSTIRIFFRFYNFRLTSSPNGYRIRSGLLHIRERLVGSKKIQYISWKANWIRKRFGLWLLEYHVSGGEELKANLKVQIPVTQPAQTELLVAGYHHRPDTTNTAGLRMHKAYVFRRVLLAGLLPAVIAGAALVFFIGKYVLLLLLLPLLVFVSSMLLQKKFRMWAMEDVLYIRKGFSGETYIMLLWHKLQAVTIRQSIYQRKRGLASIVIHTAGGSVVVHFIDLEAARAVVNYALYVTESSDKDWM